MTAPTPEQRAEWRDLAAGEWFPRSHVLALLDALDATEAALADAKARNQWLGDASPVPVFTEEQARSIDGRNLPTYGDPS